MSERAPKALPDDAGSLPPTPLSPKERMWQQKKLEVGQITDQLGKGVEEGIKETVVACNLHGIHTSQSCEGHLTEHGLPYPWIDVTAPAPEGWRESNEKKEEWKKANLEQREKMSELLEAFYANREIPPEARLTFVDRGIYGAFRLQSQAAEALEQVLPDQRSQHAEQFMLYRQEMESFKDFLKRRFEESELSD